MAMSNQHEEVTLAISPAANHAMYIFCLVMHSYFTFDKTHYLTNVPAANSDDGVDCVLPIIRTKFEQHGFCYSP